jgi:uncharacterized damage-inducible protein DinB
VQYSGVADDPLKAALDATTHQLTHCFDGIPEAALDARLTPSGLSPRQILEHLAEAYEAYLAICDGGKWNWGSYKAKDQSAEALKSNWKSVRERAVARALSSDDPEVRENAIHYIALHDAYHVGQLVQIRLSVDPEWNADGIYRH